MIIDGKLVSASLREKIASKTAEFFAKTGKRPGLAVIIVGTDPASVVYVRNKHRACEQLGMYSEVIELDATVSQSELLRHIYDLNGRDEINGILVQLPLPAHIDTEAIISAISPEKDVDGFHPISLGKLMLGQKGFVSCTPAGIVELLDYYNIPIEGKHCVIVGRSNIVGKPLAQLMISRSATVTVCHSKTKNLSLYTSSADILIAAVGKLHLITSDMVKAGAVVIDVGTNRMADGKLCGDVDTEAVLNVAQAVSPVPGGVGPMTITMLMKNTLDAAMMAYEKQQK